MSAIDARLYRATPASAPIVCEVEGNRVWEVGDDMWRPISIYTGVFTRLIEHPAAPVHDLPDFTPPALLVREED